jgi:cell wall assembly regulator SMI1
MDSSAREAGVKQPRGNRAIQRVAARQQAEREAALSAALRQHRLTFPKGRKRLPPSRSVAESWDRIVACLKRQGFVLQLNRRASTKAIAAFEKAVGSTLPDDFKESLRLHDGGDFMPPNYGEFLSLDQMREQWEMYRGWQQDEGYGVGDDWAPRELKGPIKPVFWNTKRIHVTDNSGDHVTLDLDPPRRGTYGQVLKHSHEVGPVRVLAPSWSVFLQRVVADLEAGKYVYFPDEDTLESLDELEQRPPSKRSR